jgi:hypothetical protein
MRSFELALGTFFIGAIFLIAAFVLGLLTVDVCWTGPATASPATYGIVSCSAEHLLKKQVGFGPALNWSVGLCFLLPFFVYCGSETIRHGFASINEMTRRRMFIYDDWTAVPVEVMSQLIRKRQTIIAVAVVGMIAVLTTVFIATDFFKVVGQFYSDDAVKALGQLRLGDREYEADWSIAAPVCRFTAEPTETCSSLLRGYGLNAVFAGVVYAYLPFAGSVAAISFMVAFGLFVRFVFAADLRDAHIRVVPDIRSEKRRVGFEALEDFFVYAFVSCFVLFAMGYLVTLQNVYLRTDSPNILSFVLQLFPKELTWDPAKIIESIRQSQTFGIINGNSTAVSMLGFLFLGIVIASAAAVLGREARAGQRFVLEELAKPEVPGSSFEVWLGGTPRGVARERLQNAVFWPLRWPSVNVIIIWVALAQLALLFVVIGFYIVGAGLAYVIKQASSRPVAES